MRSLLSPMLTNVRSLPASSTSKPPLACPPRRAFTDTLSTARSSEATSPCLVASLPELSPCSCTYMQRRRPIREPDTDRTNLGRLTPAPTAFGTASTAAYVHGHSSEDTAGTNLTAAAMEGHQAQVCREGRGRRVGTGGILVGREHARFSKSPSTIRGWAVQLCMLQHENHHIEGASACNNHFPCSLFMRMHVPNGCPIAVLRHLCCASAAFYVDGL